MSQAKKSLNTTRKKVKVLGTETYINKETGEVKEMQVMNIEERDANFHKIWLGHIVEALDMLGNKKLKIITYVMQNLTSENLFIMTYRELEKKLNVSRPTIVETFKSLQEANFLKRVQNGVFQINPDVIFKGYQNRRMNVLLQYTSIGKDKDDEKEETEVQKKAKDKGFEVLEGGANDKDEDLSSKIEEKKKLLMDISEQMNNYLISDSEEAIKRLPILKKDLERNQKELKDLLKKQKEKEIDDLA